MELIPGATLAGQAAGAFLRRSRVAVSLNEDYDTFGTGRVRRFFVPVDTPTQLTPLRDATDRATYSKPYAWITRNRGVQIGSTDIEFTVQALHATVALIGGSPVIEAITLPRGIALVPPPSGGPIHGRYLSVTLDDGEMTCRDIDSAPGQDIPLRFDIPQGATELFRVNAFTSERPVAWYLRLLFVVNGRKVEYELRRPKEDPFVTVPFGYPGIAASYEWRQGQWMQVHR